VLDGEPQVALAPIARGRAQDELRQPPPAVREIAEGGEDAEDRVGLGAFGRLDLGVAEGAERQVLGAAQGEGAGRNLFLGPQAGGIEPRVAVEVEAAELRLRVGGPELVLQMLAHRRAARPCQEPARPARRRDLQAERLGQGDGGEQVLRRRHRGGVRPRGHDLDQLGPGERSAAALNGDAH
jgi:hypothetical protein